MRKYEKIIDKKKNDRHIENIKFMEFLKIVQKITKKRFTRSSKRSKFLLYLNDELCTCKKSKERIDENNVDPKLIELEEKELELATQEIREAEEQIFDLNFTDDLVYTESDIEKLLAEDNNEYQASGSRNN